MPGRGTMRGRMALCAAMIGAVSLCSSAALFGGSPPRLPEGEGKQILATVCTACHSVEVVTGKKWSRERWDANVQDMIGRGAPVSQAEAAGLVNYLTRNFGVNDRARTLFVDICSSCHTLARISEQALTRDEWREETKGMISEGAAMSDEEVDLLLDYLARNFGRDVSGQKMATEEKEVK
jgi:mono/diheme cytochrome c family protein